MVVRWEARATTPQPWCRPKLAEALTVSVEDLDTTLAEGQPGKDGRSSDGEPQPAVELTGDPEQDPLLVLPWNHRGTVEAATLLSGGD